MSMAVHLGCQRVDLAVPPRVDPVDLGVDTRDVRLERLDLAAKLVERWRDDVLEERLALLVDTHAPYSTSLVRLVQCHG
jgi:hypothetical protein